MCLIVDRKDGAKVPEDYLVNALCHNPHGWGIMHAEKGRIRCQRGIKGVEFWDAYGTLGDRAATIHFRFATHGAVGINNCHPFEILDSSYAIMHNGVIDISIEDKDRSDTWHFANGVLATELANYPKWFRTAEYQNWIEHRIGKQNKLVILRADGESMVCNRSQGVEEDGLWLSNEYSIVPPKSKIVERWGKPGGWSWSDWECGKDEIGIDEAERSHGDDPDREWDLWDLRGLSDSELERLCEEDPSWIAALIRDEVGYRGS